MTTKNCGSFRNSFPAPSCRHACFGTKKTIIVRKDNIVGICRLLRDNAKTNYNYLSDITCFDRLDIMGEDEPRFEVIYNLYSMGTFQRFRLKAQVDEDDPLPLTP